MRTNSPKDCSCSVALEEASSMPINRCDPYNVVHVSSYSNTVIAGVSNGVLFLTLRQEKPASSYKDEILIDIAQNTSDSPEPPSPRRNESLFSSSLQITSAVDIDFHLEDPIGRFRPSYLSGLFGDLSESFYYDRFLAQKPASRQQLPITLSRSLFRTSGAHVVKLFSVLVKTENEDATPSILPENRLGTGVEVAFAVTSTGGWYAFKRSHWANPLCSIWHRIDSWHSVAELAFLGFSPETFQTPKEASEGYLRALHSLCTSDMAPAESNNGCMLVFLLNGIGNLLAYVVDIFSQRVSDVDLSQPEDGSPSPCGKMLDLPFLCESKAVSLCYIPGSHSLACGCEDGRIFILGEMNPFRPPSSDDFSVSFSSSQLIWPHSDVMTDLLSVIPTMNDRSKEPADKSVNEQPVEKKGSVVLVAAKGAFLTAWVLNDNLDSKDLPQSAWCHVDAFPIVSICSSNLAISENALGEDCIARFFVCSQKGVFLATLLFNKKLSNLQLSCTRILNVADIVSPVTHSTNNATDTINMTSSITESFRKRHLSSQQWMFLGFDGSPTSNIFVAATGIFCPCKASLLLSPPFSLKVFFRKGICSAGEDVPEAGAGWDNIIYDLCYRLKSEADLVRWAEKINSGCSSLGAMSTKVARCHYLLLHQASIAYTNGCCQVSAPCEIATAKAKLKDLLFKKHLQHILDKLAVEIQVDHNLDRYNGFVFDLAQVCSIFGLQLPEKLSDFIKIEISRVINRQECPVCKMPMEIKLSEGIPQSDDNKQTQLTQKNDQSLVCVCSNNHLFHLCTKSLQAWRSAIADIVPILPTFCPLCSQLSLRCRRPTESDSGFDKFLNELLLQPCVYCGAETLS